MIIAVIGTGGASIAEALSRKCDAVLAVALDNTADDPVDEWDELSEIPDMVIEPNPTADEYYDEDIDHYPKFSRHKSVNQKSNWRNMPDLKLYTKKWRRSCRASRERRTKQRRV